MAALQYLSRCRQRKLYSNGLHASRKLDTDARCSILNLTDKKAIAVRCWSWPSSHSQISDDARSCGGQQRTGLCCGNLWVVGQTSATACQPFSRNNRVLGCTTLKDQHFYCRVPSISAHIRLPLIGFFHALLLTRRVMASWHFWDEWTLLVADSQLTKE